MSRKGNCWDNTVDESFFYTKNQAKREIFEYIEFHYNRARSHSYLDNLSPSRFKEIKNVLQMETAT